MQILVFNRQRGRRVRPGGIAAFLGRLVRVLPAPGSDSVAVGLLSDRAVRAYNRTYRGKDAATDVLAFPADRQATQCGERHLGDIAVAVPTAARQAAALGHSVEREIKTLVVHAYLHLLGYDHERDDGKMLRLQARLVRRLIGVRR